MELLLIILQVCLDAQKSWPDVPCTGLGHEQTKSYMAKEELKEEIHAIVIDGSTIQYVDSVTVKVLFEVTRDRYKLFTILPSMM